MTTTLPGDITSPTAGPLSQRGALVVPRCPGAWIENNARGLGCDAKATAVVESVCICAEPSAFLSQGWGNTRLTDILLDLDQPASMDRSARWFAKHHGFTVRSTAPTWRWQPALRSCRDADGAPMDEDYPACWMLCNPAHLYAGTAKQNAADAQRDGTTARGDRSGSVLHPERLARGDSHGLRLHPECCSHQQGELCGSHKLTDAQVVAARARHRAGERQCDIAADLGVSRSTMSAIINRKTWTHL